MFSRIIAVFLAVSLLVLCVPAAFAEEPGVFARLYELGDEDPRLPLLEKVSEQPAASLTLEDGTVIEVCQGFYEGNRLYVSYRIATAADRMILHEGAPEGITEWKQVLENWVSGEMPAYNSPDLEKENGWLDGKGQRWLECPYYAVTDGIDLEDGSCADIQAGNELRLPDGTLIGWKECVVPEEALADTQTFVLGISCSDAVKFQDYKTFRETWTERETLRIPFTLHRWDDEQSLRGASAAEACPAKAELVMGRLDLRGTVSLTSAAQAASWTAWQEGLDDAGAEVVLCWNLYQNGELVSADLYGSSRVAGPEEVVYEVQFPRMESTEGLALVPVYSFSGEHPEEAIVLSPAQI